MVGAPGLVGRRHRTLFVSDVRPGRPGWPGRALARLPGRLPSLTTRSPGSADAAHAQARPACWVRRGSMRRRVSFGDPPWSWWRTRSCDLTRAGGGVSGAVGFRGGGVQSARPSPGPCVRVSGAGRGDLPRGLNAW